MTPQQQFESSASLSSSTNYLVSTKSSDEPLLRDSSNAGNVEFQRDISPGTSSTFPPSWLMYEILECKSKDEFLNKYLEQKKCLDIAGNSLIRSLFLYIKRYCSTSNSTSSDVQNPLSKTSDDALLEAKGLTLPITAIAWLSSCFYDTRESCTLCDVLSRDMRDQLPYLKELLSRHVTRLRINRDLWPPPLEPRVKEKLENIRRTENKRYHSYVKSEKDGMYQRESIFLYYYYLIQARPYLDMNLFPQVSNLALDGIPSEWIMNLQTLNETLRVMKMTNGCIFDLTTLFTHDERLYMLQNKAEVDLVNEDTHEVIFFQPLRHLNLSNCAIRDLRGLRGHDRFKKRPRILFPSLVSLTLSSNEITNIKSGLVGLTDLSSNITSLDLSYNNLSCMTDSNLILGNIRTLKLSHNKLTSVKGLEKLYSLETLWIDYNQIRTLPDIVAIALLPQLMYIRVKGNPIEEQGEPSSFRIHLMRCFLEARFDSMGDRTSYRQVLSILPNVDDLEVTKEELLALRDLSFRSATLNEENISMSNDQVHATDSSDKLMEPCSQFLTAQFPNFEENRRIKRNIARREVKIGENFELIDGENVRPPFMFQDRELTLSCKVKLEDVIAQSMTLKDEQYTADSNSFATINYDQVDPISDTAENPKKEDVIEIFPLHKYVQTDSRSMNDVEENFQEPQQSTVAVICSTVTRQVALYKPAVSLKTGETIESTISPWSDGKGTLEVNRGEPKEENAKSSNIVISNHSFAQDEMNSVYDGPLSYKYLNVRQYFELYFRSFIFPSTHQDFNTCSEQGVIYNFPRIQLYQTDRELMFLMLQKMERPEVVTFEEECNLVEKLNMVSREEIIACGAAATARITPNVKQSRGFHGDLLYENGSAKTFTDSSKVIICISDSALYIIPDEAYVEGVIGTTARRFPSAIPSDAKFNSGLWAHAYVRHPLKFLRKIKVGFRFQRLTLYFSLPSLRDALYMDDSGDAVESDFDYVYVLLTHTKARTLEFVQTVINSARCGVMNDESVAVMNDDSIVLDNITQAVLPIIIDGSVRHFQLVLQKWDHGDREPIRRVLVVTDDHIFLLNEHYRGDGTKNEHDLQEVDVGESFLTLVDAADVRDVLDLCAAVEDPRLLTIVIKSQSRFRRQRRWRIICEDGESAEKLADDIRSNKR